MLAGLDLSMDAGEVVCLIGASGSGKSTLLRCIDLLERVDDGTVWLDGRDVTDPRVNPDRVRRQIGLVFQAYNLFPHLSVLDNVTLAPRHVHAPEPAAARRAGDDAARAVRPRGQGGVYPDSLSGGQQQRAALVRAVATGPRLLLLDEVTSALDPELVGEVLTMVAELQVRGHDHADRHPRARRSPATWPIGSASCMPASCTRRVRPSSSSTPPVDPVPATSSAASTPAEALATIRPLCTSAGREGVGRAPCTRAGSSRKRRGEGPCQTRGMATGAAERTGPLVGVRVVELAGIGPAPFAAMLLADLGADVVRVDRPGGGTAFVPYEHDLLTRGRPSVAVDLKHPDGVGVVLDLAERADVLIEAFRPGVAERLGIGPDACLARNESLVYGRMTGWGQDGPLAQTAGHDLGYLAVTGALHAIGDAGGPPQVPLNLVGDFGGGAMYLVAGVLAAVIEARVSGRGQVVDAAIVDGASHLAMMVRGMRAAGTWQDQRGVNLLDGGAPFYAVYETSDERHLAVGPLEPQFYAELLDRLDLAGHPDLPDRDDRSLWPRLRQLIAERVATRSRADWVQVFDGSDACVAPVLTLDESPHHPHLAARRTFVAPDGVVQPAPAPRFSRTPTALSSWPTRPGQHTRDALQAWGIPDIDRLLADGAVREEQ